MKFPKLPKKKKKRTESPDPVDISEYCYGNVSPKVEQVASLTVKTLLKK